MALEVSILCLIIFPVYSFANPMRFSRYGIKPRLLIVGGAGTLFVKPGLRLVDTGTLPKAWMPGVKSLDWTLLAVDK